MQNVRQRREWPGLLGAALALGLSAPAWGQATAAVDSATTTAALTAVRRAYTTAVGTESVLYNGPEYVDYTVPGTKGNQYWESAEPQIGSVDYRGGHFDGVPLRYDIMRDQPVLLYPGQAVAVQLPVDKIAGFTMGPRRFVRIEGDSLNKETLPTGFYELLADGPLRLVGRHRKVVRQAIVNQALQVEYRQTDELFLQGSTSAVEITRLRRLLDALPAHQAEVQRYARQHKLKFNPRDRPASAAQLMHYYYTL